MKTTLHTYRFDLSNPDQAKAWKELSAKLRKTHPHCMESHGGESHHTPLASHDGETITLETAHLFDNQWNTAPGCLSDKGYRVFDWALDYKPGGDPKIKRGHYLDQTSEMKEIRRNTCNCGYCGKQEPAAKGLVFCPHCLDSEYLTEKDLPLLRMRPIDEDKPRNSRPPLSKTELAHLLPLYRHAQIHGTTERGKARIEKARKDIETDYKKDLAKAKKAVAGVMEERDAKTWILDHCPGMLANYIYYSHSGQHYFGWRGDGLSAEQASALLEVISEFPFPYEIKCADGRKLAAV